MAKALEKGVMRHKTAVTLQIVHDASTGLECNLFTWKGEYGEIEHLCEVANPVAETNGKVMFLSYDPARDARNAENRRLELEATL